MNQEERLAGADPALGIGPSAAPGTSEMLKRLSEILEHQQAERIVPDREDDSSAGETVEPAPRPGRPALGAARRAGFAANPAAKPDEPPATALCSPEDTARILERQLASCATLIEALTAYVMRDDSTVESCYGFLDRISALLESSASAGKVVGRLRGQVSQTLHTMVMDDRREGRRGGGGAQS